MQFYWLLYPQGCVTFFMFRFLSFISLLCHPFPHATLSEHKLVFFFFFIFLVLLPATWPHYLQNEVIAPTSRGVKGFEWAERPFNIVSYMQRTLHKCNEKKNILFNFYFLLYKRESFVSLHDLSSSSVAVSPWLWPYFLLWSILKSAL
jgi:hypothetical protein